MNQLEQDRIWQYYENDRLDNFNNATSRLKKLANYIKKTSKSGGVVLDIGIGNGEFESICMNYGINVYSLDPNADAIMRLRERYRNNSKFKIGYSNNIPFKNEKFDYVCVSEVLEHLSDNVLHESLKEIRRVLKNGGKMIGTVPSNENLKNSTVVCPCCGKIFHIKGHERSFTEKTMRNLLENEFFVVKCSAINMNNWGTLNAKGKIILTIIKILRCFGIHSSSENIFFVAEKRE